MNTHKEFHLFKKGQNLKISGDANTFPEVFKIEGDTKKIMISLPKLKSICKLTVLSLICNCCRKRI
jgi:hypothetical protein